MDPLLLLASTNTGGLACLPPEDQEKDQEGNGDGVGRLDRKSPYWYKLTTSPGRGDGLRCVVQNVASSALIILIPAGGVGKTFATARRIRASPVPPSPSPPPDLLQGLPQT